MEKQKVTDEDCKLYKKVKKGKRIAYEFVGQDRWLVPYRPGSYLVTVKDGCTSTHYLKLKLTRAQAELEAVLKLYQDGVCRAMAEASKLQPTTRKLTPLEQKAYAAFDAVMGGQQPVQMWGRSMSDIAQAGADYLRRAVKDMHEGTGDWQRG